MFLKIISARSENISRIRCVKKPVFSAKGGKIFRAKVETFSCEVIMLARDRDQRWKLCRGKNTKGGRLVGAKMPKEEAL